MSPPASSLYMGSVMHHRLRPRAHRLRYRIFMALLDLDEIDALARSFRLFSRGRFNLFAFHAGDYGNGTGEPLRLQLERHMRAARWRRCCIGRHRRFFGRRAHDWRRHRRWIARARQRPLRHWRRPAPDRRWLARA